MNRTVSLMTKSRDLLSLCKPRITLMVLLTAGGSFWLARASAGFSQLVWLFCGITLLVGSANALNMYIERDIDGRMERTRDRPLPAGRLQPRTALQFGIALGLLSLPCLWMVNVFTLMLGIISYINYVFLYTPLKQKSPLAVWIGAISGAMPAWMGDTAATNQITKSGILLFGMLFIWQIPHFFAITIFRSEEFLRAGYKTLFAKRGIKMTQQRLFGYTGMLFLLSLSFFAFHIFGIFYFIIAILLGLGFFGFAGYGFVSPHKNVWAKKFFYLSLVYLMLFYFALSIDHVIKTF